MPKVYCPECDVVISIDNPRDGARIKCPECGVELEIVSSDPFEVDFLYGDDSDDEDY
jgi:alpha-aminoadipate carrier protein LysW